MTTSQYLHDKIKFVMVLIVFGVQSLGNKEERSLTPWTEVKLLMEINFKQPFFTKIYKLTSQPKQDGWPKWFTKHLTNTLFKK